MRKNELSAGELAIEGLQKEDGSIERPGDFGVLRPPEQVEIEEEGFLWWEATANFAVPSAKTLIEFVDLENAPAERIRKYVLKWGALGICTHGLPSSHNSTNANIFFRTQERISSGCLPRVYDVIDDPDSGIREHIYFESISAWHQFSKQASAILCIAANHKSRDRGNPEHWRTVFDRNPACFDGSIEEFFANPETDLVAEQQIIFDVVTEWLMIGNVRPRLDPLADGKITLEGEGLFGALACQLMMMVSGTNALANCSACGLPYIPSRKPAAGRRSYCNRKNCGRAAADREAHRAHYERNRKTKQANLRGDS